MGQVVVEAGVVLGVGAHYVCPAIDSISFDTADLVPGELAQLVITTVGPPPSSVAWTASPSSGGTFGDPSGTSTTFECSGSGVVTITAQVLLVVPGRGNVCEGVRGTWYSNLIRCE